MDVCKNISLVSANCTSNSSNLEITKRHCNIMVCSKQSFQPKLWEDVKTIFFRSGLHLFVCDDDNPKEARVVIALPIAFNRLMCMVLVNPFFFPFVYRKELRWKV